MYTYRIISRISGIEQIGAAESFFYFPETFQQASGGPPENPRAAHLHIYRTDPNDQGLIVENSVVYIMNEEGKTVAKYDLWPLSSTAVPTDTVNLE